jgi:hypothetical protein
VAFLLNRFVKSWRAQKDFLGINACGAFLTISPHCVCKIYSLSNPTGKLLFAKCLSTNLELDNKLKTGILCRF